MFEENFFVGDIDDVVIAAAVFAGPDVVVDGGGAVVGAFVFGLGDRLAFFVGDGVLIVFSLEFVAAFIAVDALVGVGRETVTGGVDEVIFVFFVGDHGVVEFVEERPDFFVFVINGDVAVEVVEHGFAIVGDAIEVVVEDAGFDIGILVEGFDDGAVTDDVDVAIIVFDSVVVLVFESEVGADTFGDGVVGV